MPLVKTAIGPLGIIGKGTNLLFKGMGYAAKPITAPMKILGKKLGMGALGAAKGLTKGVAVPMATNAVKFGANTASKTGKYIVEHPKKALGYGFGALTAKDIGQKHIGQIHEMNAHAPARFN